MTDRYDDFEEEADALWDQLEHLRERVEQLEDELSEGAPESSEGPDAEAACPSPGERLLHALGHEHARSSPEVTERWIRDTAQVARVLERIDMVLDARDGGVNVHLNSGQVVTVGLAPRTRRLRLTLWDVEIWATMLEVEEMG